VDPIALEPVDEIVITTLMDNSYDALRATLAQPVARRSLEQSWAEAGASCQD
jgi:7,8-dihydropterin-6-yl-methyl-4-(beta-D-ribofuranosyl)aminobenzene 5'-phosphate synthase